MHILVADDEPNITRALQVRLESAGFDVSTAHTGSDALDLVQRTHPDLIILDILMPEGNGFEVLEKLNERDDTKGIPVLFLTAHGNIPNWLYVMSNGASDFIQKPFDGIRLVQTVRTTLDRWYGHDGVSPEATHH